MEVACYFLTMVMLGVKVYTASLTVVEGCYLILWVAYYAALENEQRWKRRTCETDESGKRRSTSAGASSSKRKRTDEAVKDNIEENSDERDGGERSGELQKESSNADMRGFWLVVILPACFVSTRSFQFCLQTQCLVCLPCYALKNQFWSSSNAARRRRSQPASKDSALLSGTLTLAFSVTTFAFLAYRFASALLGADAIESVLVNGEHFSTLLRYLVAFLFAASFCEQLATRFRDAVSAGESVVISQAVCVALLQLETALVGRLRPLDTPFPFLTFVALVGVLLAAAFLVFDFDLARECDLVREARVKSRSKVSKRSKNEKRKAEEGESQEEEDGSSLLRRAAHFVTSRVACCETVLLCALVLCTCFYFADVTLRAIMRYLFTSKRLAMISYWLFCVLFSLIVLLIAKRKMARFTASQKLDYLENSTDSTPAATSSSESGERQAVSRRRTLFRKWFHVIGTAVFLPGLVVDRKYTLLASLVALFAFLFVETLRVRRAYWTTGTYIQEFIEPVLAERELVGTCSTSTAEADGRPARTRVANVDMQKERKTESDASGEENDSEAEPAVVTESRRYVVTSHVFLLAGLASSLWLDAANESRLRSTNTPLAHIRLLSGILALGVGDALASTVGTRFGVLRWPRCRKTLDGTAAGFVGQLFVIVLVVSYTNSGALALRGVSELAFPALAVLCTCLVEAFTDQCDNLFLPLFMYALLV